MIPMKLTAEPAGGVGWSVLDLVSGGGCIQCMRVCLPLVYCYLCLLLYNEA